MKVNLEGVKLDEAQKFEEGGTDYYRYTVSSSRGIVYRARTDRGVAYALTAPEALALVRSFDKRE